jgi:hypothetical protein
VVSGRWGVGVGCWILEIGYWILGIGDGVVPILIIGRCWGLSSGILGEFGKWEIREQGAGKRGAEVGYVKYYYFNLLKGTGDQRIVLRRDGMFY